MRHVGLVVGMLVLGVGMTTALYLSLRGPASTPSSSADAVDTAATGTLSRVAPPRSDAAVASRADDTDETNDELTEIELELPRGRASDSDEVVVFIERDVVGRALPDTGELPPALGERLVLPVSKRRVRVRVGPRAKAIVVVDGSQNHRWTRPWKAPVSPPRDGRKREALRVRVRDASGRAVLGVPVGILSQHGPTVTSWGAESVTTLPRGIATVYLVAPSWRDTGSPDYWVAIRALTARPVAVPLPPKSERGEVIELTMPPWGRLEVDVTEPVGEPVTSWAGAHVAIDRPWSPATAVPVFLNALVVDGRAVFGVVPADTPLTVSVNADNRVAARLRGVRVRPGGHETVEMALGPRRPRLRGRVATSLPAGARVTVRADARLSSATAHGQPDADGVFDLPLNGFIDLPSPPFALNVHVRASTIDRRGFHGTKTVEITSWPVNGVIDVGDITLGAPHVLAAGRVRETDGSPVRAAYVVVEWQDEEGEWRTSTRAGGSDVDGAFTVVGDPLLGPMRLVVRGNQSQVGGPVTFEAGDRGVDLTVAPFAQFGYISGSLRLPEGLETANAWIQVWPADEDPPEAREIVFAPTLWRPVGAGTWNVRIGVPGRDDPIATADGIVVRSGETVRPRELQDIDVSFDVRVAKVTITDDAGRPVPLPKVWWRVSGGPKTGPGASYWREARPGPGGVLPLARADGDALELVATARGSGWGTLDGVTGEAVLKLPPLRVKTLRVRVSGVVAAVAGRATIRVTPVRLIPDPDGAGHVPDYTDPRSRDNGEIVRSGDAVELKLTADGAFGVSVSLGRGDGTGSGGAGVRLPRAFGDVVFDAAVSEAEIVLDPSAEEIEEALLRLGDALRGR